MLPFHSYHSGCSYQKLGILISLMISYLGLIKGEILGQLHYKFDLSIMGLYLSVWLNTFLNDV